METAGRKFYRAALTGVLTALGIAVVNYALDLQRFSAGRTVFIAVFITVFAWIASFFVRMPKMP